MIFHTDRVYKSTKRIKQGKKQLEPPFDELAQWIEKTRGVTVLNVVYDRASKLCGPRLQVIVEHPGQERKFCKGFNFDPKQQAAIIRKFLRIIGGDGGRAFAVGKGRTDRNVHPTDGRPFDVEGLFVVFSAFSPLAREEADAQITEADVAALQKRIKNRDLWLISRCFGHITFFFFTDQQMKKYIAQGKQKEYADLYFEILKPHDEFGYLKRSSFKVYFDSKENFEEKYEGNWYYYYK